MIRIAGRPADIQALAAGLPPGGTESVTLAAMAAGQTVYDYREPEELLFELSLRAATVQAALELEQSGMGFAVFRRSRCNPAFWRRTPQGGFVLLPGVRPSAAILDIFENGQAYATECATAIVIIFYRAMLYVFPAPLFDRVFPSITLLNWRNVDPLFRGVGRMSPEKEFLPGDRRYFVNPDVNPETPQWRGENVIQLRNDLFFGHGIGVGSSAALIRELNRNRAPGSQQTASLLPEAGRPDYRRLYTLRQGYNG